MVCSERSEWPPQAGKRSSAGVDNEAARVSLRDHGGPEFRRVDPCRYNAPPVADLGNRHDPCQLHRGRPGASELGWPPKTSRHRRRSARFRPSQMRERDGPAVQQPWPVLELLGLPALPGDRRHLGGLTGKVSSGPHASHYVAL